MSGMQSGRAGERLLGQAAGFTQLTNLDAELSSKRAAAGHVDSRRPQRSQFHRQCAKFADPMNESLVKRHPEKAMGMKGAPMLCELCKIEEAVKGERFCKTCRSLRRDKMK